MGFLVVIYFLVSLVAYTDFPRTGAALSLTEIEHRGLAVWRRHNCQVCHQIHGFGGFLGPDLTNRVDDSRGDTEFGPILTKGAGRMPALKLSPGDRSAVLSYLRAINRTGRSQPHPLKARRRVDPIEHFPLLTGEYVRITGHPLSAKVRNGTVLWSRFQCGSCHVPFTEGPAGAVDLSIRSVVRELPNLEALLAEGRRRMPSYVLTSVETKELRTYLKWIAIYRSNLIPVNDRMVKREKFSRRAVPWFEYR